MDDSPPEAGVLAQQFDADGNFAVPFLLEQDAGPAEGIGNIAAVVGDDRDIQQHGLDQGHAETFVFAETDKDVGGAVVAVQGCIVNLAGQFDMPL